MSKVQTVYRRQHAAYQVPIEELDVIVIDDSKSMQTIVRSMLIAMRVYRVRVFDTADEALQSMLTEPPHIILTDWKMKPTNGYQLLRSIRQRQMAPLCYVPLMFITAHGTRALVERALRSGAHHLLVKPLSPAALLDRLLWVTRDPRPMVLNGADHYQIEGMEKTMDGHREKWDSLSRARIHHEKTNRATTELQGLVDRIFSHDGSDDDDDIVDFRETTKLIDKLGNADSIPGQKGRPVSHRSGASGFAEVIRRF